jgi:hypothetical protein
MKKSFSTSVTFIFAMLILVAFSSCKKNDDNRPNQPQVGGGVQVGVGVDQNGVHIQIGGGVYIGGSYGAYSYSNFPIYSDTYLHDNMFSGMIAHPLIMTGYTAEGIIVADYAQDGAGRPIIGANGDIQFNSWAYTADPEPYYYNTDHRWMKGSNTALYTTLISKFNENEAYHKYTFVYGQWLPSCNGAAFITAYKNFSWYKLL